MAAWVEQYLSILGLRKEPPSYDYLAKICRSHLGALPFENISKLLYFRDQHQNGFLIPPVETWVQHHFDSHFGGTCYTLNYNLRELLMQLSFACDYVMLGNEHMGILVELPGERVYVDCGAAAPIFQPVRFESNPLNVSQFGDDKVHIQPVHPDAGRYKYVRYTQGKQNGKEWHFNITLKSEFPDFHDIILNSNTAGTAFMTILRCQLWQLSRGRSVSLVNNQFGIRHSDGRTDKYTLHSVAEIEEVIANEFALPKLPVREAIDVLAEVGINIFSSEK